MAHDGKITNSSGWNAVFSWIKYALTGKRDETKAVSQSSVSASSLVDLNARLEALEKLTASMSGVDSQGLSAYKTLQTAKSSPSASGTALDFIDTIAQNENGEITATKKTLQTATGSRAGSMSAAHYTKLEGIAAGAEVNVQADWDEASSSSDAFIKNKPTFANEADSTPVDANTPIVVGYNSSTKKLTTRLVSALMSFLGISESNNIKLFNGKSALAADADHANNANYSALAVGIGSPNGHPAVGEDGRPVYINSNGIPTPCTYKQVVGELGSAANTLYFF